jgi:hypothetical protein
LVVDVTYADLFGEQAPSATPRFCAACVGGVQLPVKENGRLALARVAQAEQPWGSIICDGLPARLGAHWEVGL